MCITGANLKRGERHLVDLRGFASGWEDEMNERYEEMICKEVDGNENERN